MSEYLYFYDLKGNKTYFETMKEFELFLMKNKPNGLFINRKSKLIVFEIKNGKIL